MTRYGRDNASIELRCGKHERWLDMLYRDDQGHWQSLLTTNAGGPDPHLSRPEQVRRRRERRGHEPERQHSSGARRTATGWELNCAACPRPPMVARKSRFEGLLDGLVDGLVAQSIPPIDLDTLARLYRRAPSPVE